GKQSPQLEDRRGEAPARPTVRGTGAGILVLLFRRFGIVGLLVGAATLYFFGGLGQGGGSTSRASGPGDHATLDAREEPAVQFVSFVLDDAQQSWQSLLAPTRTPYRLARLVLFRGETHSDCGAGQAQMGPFYCSRDEKVYLDLGFFDELRDRFRAAGDFAQAYIIAHEIGHHVQNVVGTFERARGSGKQNGASGVSVRMELQADCYAGVWGHSAAERDILEPGDLEEALRAATAIGDDVLQRKARGTVRPESFTHGTSEQRVRWFRRGFEAGDMRQCDTFSVTRL
ncbi:MAG: neutral zinc metallopeptidase, partial [Polyangiaceae bacterium]|nr:neutral zinc metallopeptidase [Polyangiaceae bacterium]